MIFIHDMHVQGGSLAPASNPADANPPPRRWSWRTRHFILHRLTFVHPRPEEITVERINVVEPDGTRKLVIASSARQTEATIGGVEVPIQRRLRTSGIELVDRPTDRTLLDVLALMRELEAIEDPDERARARAQIDGPATFGAPRMFVGRTAEGHATTVLMGGRGRPRPRMTG